MSSLLHVIDEVLVKMFVSWPAYRKFHLLPLVLEEEYFLEVKIRHHRTIKLYGRRFRKSHHNHLVTLESQIMRGCDQQGGVVKQG